MKTALVLLVLTYFYSSEGCTPCSDPNAPRWHVGDLVGIGANAKTLERTFSSIFEDYTFNNPCCNKEEKAIPNQVDVNRIQRCSADEAAVSFSTKDEYKESQSSSYKVSATWKDWVGSASEEEKEVEERIIVEERSVTIVHAKCEIYEAKIARSAQLSPTFIEDLANLPPTVEGNLPAYFDFLDTYGAIVRAEASIGGLLVQTSFTHKSYLKTHTTEEQNEQASLKFKSVVDIEASEKYERDLQHEYTSNTVFNKLETRGGELTKDYAQWAKTIPGNEDVATETWYPLTTFITKSRMKNYNLSEEFIDNRRQAVEKAIYFYMTPTCEWNTTLDAAKVRMVAHISQVNNQPSQIIEFTNTLSPGQSFSLPKPWAPEYLGGIQIFAYMSPNFFKFECIRTSEGFVVAKISQGDGLGPYKTWPDCCSWGLCLGETDASPCALWYHPNNGCFAPATGQAGRCKSQTKSSPGPFVLQGYHAHGEEDLWRGYSIEVSLSCEIQ